MTQTQMRTAARPTRSAPRRWWRTLDQLTLETMNPPIPAHVRAAMRSDGNGVRPDRVPASTGENGADPSGADPSGADPSGADPDYVDLLVGDAIPVLSVHDLDESVSFYRALGFRAEIAFPEGQSDGGSANRAVTVEAGGIELSLVESPYPNTAIASMTGTSAVRIRVHGVDTLHAEFRRRLHWWTPDAGSRPAEQLVRARRAGGATTARLGELRSSAFGVRSFTVHDPSNHELTFAQATDDL